MAFEYKFGKKKSDIPEPIISQDRLEKIKKHTRKQGWFPEFTLEKQAFGLEKHVEELTKQLEEKDEMLQCLIETKDKVIANLNKQIELQNNLNDLIKKMQENREKKD